MYRLGNGLDRWPSSIHLDQCTSSKLWLSSLRPLNPPCAWQAPRTPQRPRPRASHSHRVLTASHHCSHPWHEACLLLDSPCRPSTGRPATKHHLAFIQSLLTSRARVAVLAVSLSRASQALHYFGPEHGRLRDYSTRLFGLASGLAARQRQSTNSFRFCKSHSQPEPRHGAS